MTKIAHVLAGLLVMLVGAALVPMHAWLHDDPPSWPLVVTSLTLALIGAMMLMPRMQKVLDDIAEIIRAWRGGQ